MSPEPQAQEILERVLEPQYWRELCPDMHIEDQEYLAAAPVIEFDPDFLRAAKKQLIDEGYVEFPPTPREFQAIKLQRVVKRLNEEGWMPPLAFVYDEFWTLFRSMYFFLGAILGEGYRMLPDFWVWYLRPELEEVGWAPHRDKGRQSLFEDGSPKSLTVWIALSEATPLNGCMYILPAHLDPVYRTEEERKLQIVHQFSRALPASPGTAFCWNQAVVHWGSAASRRAKNGRISAAFEFQRNDVEPYNEPLMDPMLTPFFKSRLKLIGKQILQYTHMYPLTPLMEEVAQGLMKG